MQGKAVWQYGTEIVYKCSDSGNVGISLPPIKLHHFTGPEFQRDKGGIGLFFSSLIQRLTVDSATT